MRGAMSAAHFLWDDGNRNDRHRDDRQKRAIRPSGVTSVNPIQSLIKVFESRKMAALIFLGFASGLPLFLTSKALQAWMTTAGVSTGVIGLFSIVALPYSLKFIWAPLFDRFRLPFLGHRRGWLLVMQIALMGAIAWLSTQDPSSLQAVGQVSQDVCVDVGFFRGWCETWQVFKALSVSPFFLVAMFVAFLSATQDVNVDAYRTDVLNQSELGAGAAVFVTGYRLALIITGAVAFILADPKQAFHLSWGQTYLLLAFVMLLGVGATLLAPEPPVQPQRMTLTEAVVKPFQEFYQRLGGARLLAVLSFMVLYKFGDALLSNMATPFLLKTGFSQTAIGTVQGGMGIVATIVGTLVGGSIFSKIGINKSLWLFGGLQALSNLAYWVLALAGPNEVLMTLAINIENFCGGLGNAGFLGFMMSICNPLFSATQFALLSSLMAVSRDILVAPAGKLAEGMGWSNFFLLTIAAAIPGLMLLPLFAPWNGRAVNADEADRL
jgi:MFS transporter, PAT family, beta-lactamase induction signal transducer AmpG